MGGKSKSTTVGYHYRPAFHVGLVGRQIDAFLEYRAADKTAWAGELTASGRIQIDAPDLFGGEKDQGGIVGPVDVMFGEPDQMPNPYLVAEFGPQTVAWRGMTTLAFCGGRFGAMNPYQQKSAYKIRKIKAGWHGDWGGKTCWYPERAEVPLTSDAPEYIAYWRATPDCPHLFTSPSQISTWPISPDAYTVVDTAARISWPTGVGQVGLAWLHIEVPVGTRREFHLDVKVNYDDSGKVIGAHRLAIGAATPPNPVPTYPTEEGVRVVVPPHSGPFKGWVAFACVDGRDIETGEPLGSPTEHRMLNSLTQPIAGLYGINPAHLLYYVRTDPEKGAEPQSSINEASLVAAADTLYSEGFGLCQVVYDPAQDTPDSMTERICRIIGGSFERSLVDGQWYLDLARGDYDLESLPIMGDDDILELKRQPTTLHGVTNSLSVRYFDPSRKEAVITPAVRALGLIRAFGEVHETLDFPEIPDAGLALRVADRELRARVTPSEGFEGVTRPRAGLLALRRGQYFRLQSPKRGIADMVCIVGEKDAGTLRSGAIRWKFAQDIYNLPASTYVEVEEGVDVRPPQYAEPIENCRAFEAPYIYVAGSLPRAELDALPDDVGYLLGVAARPAHGLDYTLAARPEGGEFDLVANGEWCPTATCAVAIPLSDAPVNIPLDTVRGLDRVPIGAPVLMGDEILRLDAKQFDPPQVTLARGCADSVPVGHGIGARMWFLGDEVAGDTTEYSDGESVAVRFLANTGSHQFPIEQAATQMVEFAGRAARPYAPGHLRISDDSSSEQAYPGTCIGQITVSWAHRDRVLQADQLIDARASSIGPEPGTTYTVRYYINGILDHLESEITSATATPVILSANGLARVEVEAVRDGLSSWQAAFAEFAYQRFPGVPYVDQGGIPYADQNASTYEG